MRLESLAARVLPLALRYAEQHEPTQTITNGHSELVYLRRWKIKNAMPWTPGVYVHSMLLDDDSSRHDHPYASISLILTDGLEEEYQTDPPHGVVTLRTLRAGDVVYRSRWFAHRLIVREPAWTLFVPGWRLPKDWGFYCPQGKVHHVQYGKNQDAALARGETHPLIGCGEQEETLS